MQRKTPLRNDPEKQRAWRERSKPLRPAAFVDTPSLQPRERVRPPKDPITAAVRQEVYGRAGGRCERCRRNFTEHLHHIHLRRHGDHTTSNLVSLCRTCHDAIHAHPKESHVAGWLHSAKWERTIPWISILVRRSQENSWL